MIDRIGRRRPYKLYVREWIDHRGLDQKRVAELMGIEPGTLSKLINSHLRWKEDQLAGVAYVLNVDVPDLYRDPARPTQADLLRDVPPERQADILRVVRALTGTD